MGTIGITTTDSTRGAAVDHNEHRQAALLQAVGAGALGLLIGFGLGVAGGPSSTTPLPLVDRATSDQIAPVSRIAAQAQAVMAPLQAAVPDIPAALAPSAEAGQVISIGVPASGPEPLPSTSSMEPCWAVRDMVNC